jgi:Bifunctional DNA primase/polymerase, N-terminal
MTKLILYGTFRNAALDYGARGWPVFPLKPGGKTPLPGHGPRAATTNAQKIDAWWTRWPAANIGLDCRRAGLVVIVVDADKGGLVTWAALNLRTPTLSSQTGRGFHFIYALPAGQKPVRSSAGRLGPGVGVRSADGYIVLPPSVLANGEAHEWLVFNDGKGGVRPVSPLPRKLLALTRKSG